MKNNSAIIIGKGPSILKTNRQYVENFDKIIIANRPVWDGYEKYIPKKAHIQYRNNSTDNFSKQQFINLGIEKVVSTALPCEPLPYEAHHGIAEVVYSQFELDPEDDQSFAFYFNKKKVNPSTGILAVYHTIKSNLYNKIALVGFDLIVRNKRMYYFKPNEMQQNKQFMFGLGYYSSESNGFLSLKHNTHSENSGEFLIYLMENNKNIQFEVTTENQDFVHMLSDLENVEIL